MACLCIAWRVLRVAIAMCGGARGWLVMMLVLVLAT
jgi:hypothetical protein